MYWNANNSKIDEKNQVGSICSKHNDHHTAKRKLDLTCIRTLEIPHKVFREAPGIDLGNFSKIL